MFPIYTLKVPAGVAVTTAISILQLKAGVNGPIEILRAAMTQSGLTASEQRAATLIRKTAAATVTAASAGTHLVKNNPLNPTSDASLGTAATGHTATVEGTDGEQTSALRGFNVLNGYEWISTPAERIIVPQGGIIAIKILSAPSGGTWYPEIVFRELRGG